jgi:hypothetical protein
MEDKGFAEGRHGHWRNPEFSDISENTTRRGFAK